MSVTKDYSIACVQVLEVLKGLNKDEFDRIPKERIELYENNKEKDYEFQLNENIDLKDQLSDTAQAMIANLFVRFIATYEDKRKIYETEKKEYIDSEIKKRHDLKLNPLFKEKEKISKDETEEKNEVLVIQKKGILEKIFDKIKSLFKLGKK